MGVEEDFEGNSIQDDWLARSSQNLACSMIFQRVAIELTQRRVGGHCWHHLRSWRANLVTPIVPHQTWTTNTMASICVWMFGRFQNRAGLLNLMVGASNPPNRQFNSQSVVQPLSLGCKRVGKDDAEKKALVHENECFFSLNGLCSSQVDCWSET
jgi:hypothetical protein